jgi:hypothetical protein
MAEAVMRYYSAAQKIHDSEADRPGPGYGLPDGLSWLKNNENEVTKR